MSGIEETRTKPVKKFSSRAGDKRFQEAGLYVAVESYNIYVITTLLYIAQLEHPSEEAIKEEKEAIYRTIKGPGMV